jgi:RHS repeat-associated protein
MRGNWERYQFDGGGFTDNLDDVRAHAAPGGLANEITEWFPWPAGSPAAERPAEPAYDEPRTMTGQDYILADLNLDGVVDQTNLNLLSNYTGATGGWGILTSSTGTTTVGNEIGYAGYIFDAESGLSCVRYRYLHHKAGRWMHRDPARYIDGMNLYQYANSQPLMMTDAWGLAAAQPQMSGTRGWGECFASCITMLGAFCPRGDIRCYADLPPKI